jgi:hypothetical protein
MAVSDVSPARARQAVEFAAAASEGGNMMGAVVGSRGRTNPGSLKVIAISLVVPLLLTACVNATSSAAPSAPPAPTATPSAVPSASPTEAPAATLAPTATTTPVPTPTAEPTPKASPRPGQWTGIKWTALGKIPQLYPANSDAPDTYSIVNVYGFSRGYVGFQTIVTSNSRTGTGSMVSTFSSDAVSWTPDKALSAAGIDYPLSITAVLESPAGLLAIGRITGMACGGPSTVSAMWTSTDGLSWSRVTPPADFASASVYTIDGGSSGYIATGILKDGITQALWVSSDGRTWHSKLLPKSVFGDVIVQGGTSFAGGFVVSGAVRGDEGCGGYRYQTPSLWWSSDGSAWTRSTLTGTAPSTDSTMSVARVNDHTLMAIANEWNDATQTSTTRFWVTSDGRTWKLVAKPSSYLGSNIRTDGNQGLAIVDNNVDPAQTAAPLTIAAVGDDLSARVLPQTGDAPTAAQSPMAWNSSIGPAGLIVLSADGSNLWLGTPLR